MKSCCISRRSEATFLAVDALANEMFDNIDGLGSRNFQAPSLFGKEQVASDEILRFARSTAAADANTFVSEEVSDHYQVRRIVIVEAVKHAFRPGKLEQTRGADPIEIEGHRVGAAWYPTLPPGVEHLKSAGREYSEEETSAAIKSVMLEQKREVSRRKLPDLAPSKQCEAFPAEVEKPVKRGVSMVRYVLSAIQEVNFLTFQPLIMTALSMLLFANL